MKYLIIIIVQILILLSCSIDNNNKIIKTKIDVFNINRSGINELSNPLVDLTLTKDSEDFFTVSNFPLTVVDDSYALTIDLLSGSNYIFEEFNIYSEGELIYILDKEYQLNIEGFRISPDGVYSNEPKVYLKNVTDIEYDEMTYESFSVDILTDNFSTMEPEDLTFEISSNIENATFTIYKYTIYWVTGPTLENNNIFDMDTGELYDPLDYGDGEVWGNGKFKIVTTNDAGEIVFVVGFSEEWNKKHIHLIL